MTPEEVVAQVNVENKSKKEIINIDDIDEGAPFRWLRHSSK